MRLIALMGVDGAGKTTLAEGLVSSLDNDMHKCNFVYMGRGRMRIFPGGRSIAKSVGVDLPPDQVVAKGKGLSHILIRTARDTLYLLDAFTRYLRYILPRKVKGELTVTDRYPYDLVLNEGTAGWARWVLLHLYPAPDLLIYLHGDPKVIHQRKPFYTPERLAHDMKKLDQVVNQVESSGRSLVLRITPQEPETTLSETLRYVH